MINDVVTDEEIQDPPVRPGNARAALEGRSFAEQFRSIIDTNENRTQNGCVAVLQKVGRPVQFHYSEK